MNRILPFLGGLFLLSAFPVSACDPTESGHDGMQSGDHLQSVQAPVVDASAASGTCQPFDPCVAVTADYPFVRVGNAPVFDVGGCFSVTRDSQKYVLLVTEFEAGPGQGFYRSTSLDGSTWESLSTAAVFPGAQEWFVGIKCPDLQFNEDGKLHLYFSGEDPTDHEKKFGHATSTNYGRNWTVDPAPVFESANAGWEGPIDMPSVIDTGTPGPRRYVLAYFADPPAGPGLTGEIGVAFSPDGLTWTKSTNNPVVKKGTDQWNCRVAGRPRLVLAPDGDLHMFYAGDRICAKVLHAVSTNGGASWRKDALPIFDLPADTTAWDYGASLYCTSFTWDPYPDQLQMFYTGKGFHVGLATAPWSEIETSVVVGTDGALGPREENRLFATPNPSSGATLLHLREIAGTGSGRLLVHDVSGRLIRVLWSGAGGSIPGQVSWDGRGSNGRPVPGGRYLATFKWSDGPTHSDWITLLR